MQPIYQETQKLQLELQFTNNRNQDTTKKQQNSN